MTNNETLEPLDKFTYQVDFRYKKFNKDLRLTDFIASTVINTDSEPVPEYLERNWIGIVEALNPDRHKIELVNVTI